VYEPSDFTPDHKGRSPPRVHKKGTVRDHRERLTVRAAPRISAKATGVLITSVRRAVTEAPTAEKPPSEKVTRVEAPDDVISNGAAATASRATASAREK